MNRRLVVLASVASVALALGSPLGATPTGEKPVRQKPIRIDSRVVGIEGGSGKFFLALGTAGDLGKVTFTRSFRPAGEVEATALDGQRYVIATETDTLKGRNGTLVIRAVGPAYSLGIGDYEVWKGTWSIVNGTGDYSGLRGSGRYFGIAVQTSPPAVTKRYTGFVRP
jgi:hypothetical protein